MDKKESNLIQEMINIGKRLYEKRLVVATAGNLSCRLNGKNILITASGTSLGSLKESDILKVNIDDEAEINSKPLSTEFPLHQLIYKNFSHQAVIHCHPPLINGYFAVNNSLKNLTFESKLYLGDVQVIPQDTPSITKPELVIEALKTNNLAVIKNHGVVAVGSKFSDSLNLIETLEEAVRIAALARLFDKEALEELDTELKVSLEDKEGFPMFSEGHIKAIVDLVNQDKFIAEKGAELGLTTKLAIKLDGRDKIYKFNFEKGKIVKLEFDEEAPFVISAPANIWELIFLGKLDPFVATTQGRMKLKGELGKLSRWYVPFSRLFEIFKQVKIK